MKERNFQEESFLLAKVAKTYRADLFNNGITFSRSFIEGCQDALPVVHQLISMILLYGQNMSGAVSHTQPTKTLSQLIIHSAKKREIIPDVPANFRQSSKREPPVPLYIGLNIHKAARDKKMIKNFEQLGISISYDRILQLESLLTRSLCEQFKKDNIVCPQQRRKKNVTDGAIDNLDHNSSSATPQGSIHGTEISIIQHPTTENQGEIRSIQFSTNPILKEADLPDITAL